MIVGLVGVGVAGSRGPFVGMLFAVILTPIFKLNIKYSIILIGLFLVLLIFNQPIMNFLNENFNVLYERTMASILEGDMSGREYIFADAIAQIQAHPIIGDWHLLYYKNGVGNFSHNIVLDSWMSLGIIIGSFIIIFIFLLYQKSNKAHFRKKHIFIYRLFNPIKYRLFFNYRRSSPL